MEELFFCLISLVHLEDKGISRLKAYIIDSTTFPLNKTRYPWAEFRTSKSGVISHLRLALLGSGDIYPDKLSVTNAQVHDVNQLEILIGQKLATYIFDRGYLDFELFDRLFNDRFLFVSRIKKNTLTHAMNIYTVPPESTIESDQMVVLGGRNAYLTDPYCLMELRDIQGNPLRLITNRFDLSAEEINQMYRSRWEIEFFFKHLKQQTMVKKFYSQDENGLKNQLYVALIAQLLTYLIKLRTKSPMSSLTMTRYLLAFLWEEKTDWFIRIRGKPS